MTSNFLDIIYIVTMSISVAAGLYVGATKLLVSFIFFILSFVFAYLIFVPVTDVMHEYISGHFMMSAVSVAVSYIICAISCAIISGKLKALVEDISGGATDRVIGFVIGGVRGLMISLLIFTAVTIFVRKSYATAKNLFELVEVNPHIKNPHWVEASKFHPELKSLLDKAIEVVGKDELQKILLPRLLQADEHNPSEHKETITPVK